MIKFRVLENEDWNIVTPTIFPDGTSQVWKTGVSNYGVDQVTIRWNFENEAELLHLFQLSDLLAVHGYTDQHLEIPYLPYARQDKAISDNTTFARTTFLNILNSVRRFEKITVYDIHSDVHSYFQKKILNKRPDHFLKAIEDFKPDVIFFPDEGAMKRYQTQFLDTPKFSMLAKMYGNKVRNQITGEITDYRVTTWKDFHDGERVLIVDDICDAGGTFVAAAKKLYLIGVTDIGLCVSHGLFSKGFEPLYDARIKRIYTTDSFGTAETRHLFFKAEDFKLTIYKSL